MDDYFFVATIEIVYIKDDAVYLKNIRYALLSAFLKQFGVMLLLEQKIQFFKIFPYPGNNAEVVLIAFVRNSAFNKTLQFFTGTDIV